MSINDLGTIDKIDLDILNTAFNLIPIENVNAEHKQLVF